MSQQSGLRCWKHFFSGLMDWSQYPARRTDSVANQHYDQPGPFPHGLHSTKSSGRVTLGRLRDANRLLNIGSWGVSFLASSNSQGRFHVSGMAINQAEIFMQLSFRTAVPANLQPSLSWQLPEANRAPQLTTTQNFPASLPDL